MTTKIEWCEESWNPIVMLCPAASAGCQNCYARKMVKRQIAMGTRGYVDLSPEHPAALVESELDKPLHWRKPRTIFVCSMGDLFADAVPEEWIRLVFITMSMCPQHTFIVLTKRAKRMRDVCAACPWFGKTVARIDVANKTCSDAHTCIYTILPNVWLGVTVEDQSQTQRIEQLIDTPAAVRWVSVEPMLDPVDLAPWIKQLDWVVVGGESGDGARPCLTEWIDDLVDACKLFSVPAFVKQQGSHWAHETGLTKAGQSKGQDPATWPVEWPREYPR